MLRISPACYDALVVAHAERFRDRAQAYVSDQELSLPLSTVDEALARSESIAARANITAEQSRLSLLMMALLGGPDCLTQPEVSEALADTREPERARVRRAVDALTGAA